MLGAIRGGGNGASRLRISRDRPLSVILISTEWLYVVISHRLPIPSGTALSSAPAIDSRGGTKAKVNSESGPVPTLKKGTQPSDEASKIAKKLIRLLHPYATLYPVSTRA
jgi:hypothetical protein